MHPILTIAVRAARRAGSIINRAALDSGGLRVTSKRAKDFVTQVDHAAEEAIIDIVKQAYPEHGFLAEESGAAKPDRRSRTTSCRFSGKSAWALRRSRSIMRLAK